MFVPISKKDTCEDRQADTAFIVQPQLHYSSTVLIVLMSDYFHEIPVLSHRQFFVYCAYKS
jgi:hypothetical protein